MAEHILTFESSDYYGPDLKLEINCSNAGAVSFSIEGEGSGMQASVLYSLFETDQVDKVISELSAWRERYRERTGQ